jgi:hypothetical protein
MSNAPFFLQRVETRPDIPDTGRFLLPVCITRDELIALVSAVERYMRFTGIWDVEALWPILQAIEYIGRPEMALCFNGAYNGYDCLEFPAFASFVDYFPDNPYIDDEPLPPGYLMQGWWRWGAIQTPFGDYVDGIINDAVEWFSQYQATDAICWIGSLLSLNIPAWLGSGYVYPAVEVHCTGKGIIEVALLSVPFGGRAILELDQAPNPVDILLSGVIDPAAFIIDTHRDITSVPFEKNPVIRFQVPVETDGDHTLYIMFLPTINFSISDDAIGFGGGIRSIELCGGLRPAGAPEPPPPPPLEGVEELRPEFQFSADCGFEYRLRNQNDEIVQDWTPVAGWDTNAALCFGSGDMATKQDIKEALIEWTKDTALKIVSGATSGFEIDEDGNVIIGGEDGEDGLPEDDPATEVDETAAARSGGATAVRIGINSIWSNLNAWYGASVALAEAQNRLKLIYNLEPTASDALVSEYWSARQQAQPYVSSFASTLDSYLYCKANNPQVLAEWIYEVHTTNQQFLASKLVPALTQAQMDDWFTQGMEVPSTDYQAYSCVPIDPEQWILDAAYLQTSAYKTGASIGKINHRILIEVSGKVNHPSDGSYQDFFYHVAANGTKTYVGAATSFGTLQFNDNLSNPPQNKNPWKASGVYAVTMETTSAQAYRFRRAISAANMAAGTTGFTIKLTDLGEVIN